MSASNHEMNSEPTGQSCSTTDMKDIDNALDDHGLRAAGRRGRHQSRAADLPERPFAHKLRDFILSRHVPLDRAATFPADLVPARMSPSRACEREHFVEICSPSLRLVDDGYTGHSSLQQLLQCDTGCD